MIRSRFRQCTISDELFVESLTVIERSGAADTIEDYYRQSSNGGGRSPLGITFTVKALLVAMLIRFRMGRPFYLRGAMDTIGEMTPDQRARVGMPGQDVTAILTDGARTYGKLHGFWTRRVQPLDSFSDIPARRMPNSAFRGLLSGRTEEQIDDAARAAQRLATITNDILAASIWDKTPKNCVGDLVADETLLDTATLRGDLGVALEKMHAASPLSEPWARERASGQIKSDLARREITKAGNGIGITMLTRVARRDAIHSEPSLFVGMASHSPTGGSVEGLAQAIAHARRNGVDGRRSGRHRWPLITVDMGYNPKRGFAELMLKNQLSPITDYPAHWTVQFASANPIHTPTAPPPGPIQYSGAFYCPAVQNILKHKERRSTPTRTMLNNDSFRNHDRFLQELYPYLMGTHTRPFYGPPRTGRPRLGEQTQNVPKQRLVCPAAMGTVQCPLKPESLTPGSGTPLVEPTWTAEAFGCCSASSVTVNLTPDQLRMAQWDFIHMSWEYLIYRDALRALTEQRFNMLKTRAVTGLDDLKSGPRRPPTVLIGIALAAAATNLVMQHHHDPRRMRADAFDIKWRQLENDLGRPPTRMPPRT